VIMRPVTNALVVILMLLTIADGCLFLYIRGAHTNASENVAFLHRIADASEPIKPPTGIDLHQAIVKTERTDLSGWAIRYASVSCPYCRKDNVQWELLGTKLKAAGYQLVVMVPALKDAYLEGAVVPTGTLQEVFVELGWIRHFRLSATPTLLLFDRKAGLIWGHEGTLSADDVASAVRTVDVWKAK